MDASIVLLFIALVGIPVISSSLMDPRVHQEIQAGAASQLVLFYSPHCPKCNAFLTTYYEIIDYCENSGDLGTYSITRPLTHSLSRPFSRMFTDQFTL